MMWELKDLESWDERIREKVAEFGLECFVQEFEVCDHEEMLGYMAYSGMPSRYPHWSYGKAFEKLKTMYDYGVSGLPYEMVINSNPSLAYLMRDNSLLLQILTIAHVYGHNDFFKNNFTFKTTRPEHVLGMFKAHATRVRRYMEDPSIGLDKVEAVLDAAHALSLQCRRNLAIKKLSLAEERERLSDAAKPKDDPYSLLHKRAGHKEPSLHKVPPSPEEDLLVFIAEHNPLLSNWERDLLNIVHEETRYFIPQIETKVMNEGWACLVGSSRVFTDRGLLKIRDIVDGREPLSVSDGRAVRRVYDWARFDNRQTVRIRTKRGYELEGSTTHRVLLEDGGWRALGELKPGDRVALGMGMKLWPDEPVRITWQAENRLTLEGVAKRAGVNLSTVFRHKAGLVASRSAAVLDPLLVKYEEDLAAKGLQGARLSIRVPEVVDAQLASFLGYLLSDGNISRIKRVVSLTTGDEAQARRFADLAALLFGIEPRLQRDGKRLRVHLYSQRLICFLTALGCPSGYAAARKTVPEAILRSPKEVVAAFLSAYFDGDGHAGKWGIILSTTSEEMGRLVQLLLSNFGIISSRKRQKDGCFRLHIAGRSAEVFAQDINFGLERKREALARYLRERRWFKPETCADVVVALEMSQADVYDMSVAVSHAYAAEGMINHNSFWHREILNSLELPQDLYLEFLVRHNQVLRPAPGGLNPYHLGLKVWEDILRRAGGPSLEEREAFGIEGGEGVRKLFEVRESDRDVSFLRRFLTPELMRELDLFQYQARGDDLVISEVSDEEGWEQVKATLLKSVGMGSVPIIKVEDAGYGQGSALQLKHYHDGRDLHLDYAERTLSFAHRLWGRKVVLETIINGRATLLGYNESGFAIRAA